MNKEIILQEIESLMRTLDFVQEEQAFVKRKLISLLENIGVNDFVNWAEDLHQDILNREASIQLLKSDVLALRSVVKTKKSINNIVDPGTIHSFKNIKQQVSLMETEFVTWKHVVNDKLESPHF